MYWANSEISKIHCVKSVRIYNYSDPYFPQLDRIRTRITPNTDTLRCNHVFTICHSFSRLPNVGSCFFVETKKQSHVCWSYIQNFIAPSTTLAARSTASFIWLWYFLLKLVAGHLRCSSCSVFNLIYTACLCVTVATCIFKDQVPSNFTNYFLSWYL